jgi:hypothetical protein
MLAVAEDLARQVGIPSVVGMVTLARGLASHLDGRWGEGRRILNDAERIFRDQCTGATWELDMARTFSMWCTMLLGDVVDARIRWPAFIEEARARGDKFAEANLGTYMMAWLLLINDDVSIAEQSLDSHSRRHWGRSVQA